MSVTASALYFGKVVHQRMTPRRHRLSYSVFSMLIDLDEADVLHRCCRVFSYNRFNLFSFYDRDHGDGGCLRQWVDGLLAEAGIAPDRGAVRLLCYPRILGYVFNPLSVYFCHGRGGELTAILYEVNNTFGQRHTYVIPVAHQGVHGANEESRGPLRQECDKAFYVSPFNAVVGRYLFRIEPPGDGVAVDIDHHDSNGRVLYASFRGRRRPFSDALLLQTLVRYPLLTLKVIAGIHWEAFRLWRKGLRVVERPAPPPQPVTVVGPPPPLRSRP